MGTSLNGLTPSATYTGLLKFGDNSAISASLKAISDGAGNDTILELSTTALQIGGSTGAFWDNTNKRLGVGTNAPAYGLDVSQNISGNLFAKLQNTSATGFGMLLYGGSGASTYTMQFADYNGSGGGRIYPDGIFIGAQSAPTARLQIQGSGTTAATLALLVQNGSGANLFKVRDDGNILCEGGGAISSVGIIGTVYGLFGGGANYEASASLVCGGTTQGFLPPRMTTTQRNAISSPATGLMIYNTTTNKLNVYTTAWEAITSL